MTEDKPNQPESQEQLVRLIDIELKGIESQLKVLGGHVSLIVSDLEALDESPSAALAMPESISLAATAQMHIHDAIHRAEKLRLKLTDPAVAEKISKEIAEIEQTLVMYGDQLDEAKESSSLD